MNEYVRQPYQPLNLEFSVFSKFYFENPSDTYNPDIKSVANICPTENLNSSITTIKKRINEFSEHAKKKGGYGNLTRRSVGIHKVFCQFQQNNDNDRRALSLADPGYGLTQIVSEAKPDGIDCEAVVISKVELKRCFEDYCKKNQQDELNSDMHAFAGLWNSIVDGTCGKPRKVLEKSHFVEASKANKDLPRMGLVTVVVAFEEYVHKIIEESFMEVKKHATSVAEFNKTWPGSKLMSPCKRCGPRQVDPLMNMLHSTFGEKQISDIELQKLSDKFRECAEMKEFEPLINTVTQLCVKSTKLCQDWIDEVLENVKKEAISGITNPLLITISTAVRQLQTCGKNSNPDAFNKTLTTLLNGQTTFNRVFVTLRVTRKYSLKSYEYRYCLKEQDIKDYLILDTQSSLKFDFAAEKYVYTLQPDDKKEILKNFTFNVGWRFWIDPETYYFVKINDAKTLGNLMRLFYGIRCILSHGSPDRTINSTLKNPPSEDELNVTVIMKVDTAKDALRIYMPADPDAPPLSDTPANRNSDVKEIKKHILSLWNEARAVRTDEKLAIKEVPYHLYYSVRFFYAYAAKMIGRAIACTIWPKITRRSKHSQFDFCDTDLKKILQMDNHGKASSIEDILDEGLCWGILDEGGAQDGSADKSESEISASSEVQKQSEAALYNVEPVRDTCDKGFHCPYKTFCFKEHKFEEDDYFRFAHPAFKSAACVFHYCKGGCKYSVGCEFYHSIEDALCYNNACPGQLESKIPHKRASECHVMCEYSFRCPVGNACLNFHTEEEIEFFKYNRGVGQYNYKKDQCDPEKRDPEKNCLHDKNPWLCPFAHGEDDKWCFQYTCSLVTKRIAKVGHKQISACIPITAMIGATL